MITMEEEIWDYIDGKCTAEQIIAIEIKIASDPAYRSLYEEFLSVHQQMDSLELDEPSMSFTRNVMEQVKLEIPPVALKTKVDTRIIYGIAAFFGLSLLALTVYVISNLNFTMPAVNMQTESLDFSKYLTPTFIKVFILIDIILGLIYLDSVFRRKKA